MKKLKEAFNKDVTSLKGISSVCIAWWLAGYMGFSTFYGKGTWENWVGIIFLIISVVSLVYNIIVDIYYLKNRKTLKVITTHKSRCIRLGAAIVGIICLIILMVLKFYYHI